MAEATACPERRYMRGLGLNEFPPGMNLELTARCCLRCDFCLNGKPGFREKGDMDIGLVRRLAAELPAATRITLCGIGEPALHPEFAEICRELGRKFGGLYLVTNGQGPISPVLDAVFSAGFSKVTVSLDYFGEALYRRRKGGAVGHALEFIDGLLERKAAAGRGPSVQINMLAQKGVAGQVRACLKYFSGRLGPGDLVYSRHIKDLAGQVEVKPAGDTDSDLEWFKVKVDAKAGAANYAVENWPKFLGLDAVPSTRLPCRHLYLYAMVLWDGRVAPCCLDFNGRMPLGDLNHQTLKAIWNGQAYRALRGAMERGHFTGYPLCQNCGEWYKQK